MPDASAKLALGVIETGTSLDKLKYDPLNETTWLGSERSFPRVPFFISDPIDTKLAANGATFSADDYKICQCSPIQMVGGQNMSIMGGDGVAFNKDRLIYDTTFDLAPWEPQSNLSNFVKGSNITVKRTKFEQLSTDFPVFLGFNGRYTNYCHWMQQLLPWHVSYIATKQLHPGLKLVLPELHLGGFALQTLDLLHISQSDIIFLKQNEILLPDFAYICGRFDLWKISDYLVSAARLLANSVDKQSRHRRIYIHRAVDRRSLINFVKLRPILIRNGFDILELENMSVEDQISTFRSAKTVVAEHGAGMINMLFCQPGTTILELFNPACVQPAFWSIASACGHRYGYLVGTHSGNDNPGWNSSYTLSPERFEQALVACCESEEANR